ncbi:MAG TPA: DUF998 domain-containing protein [Chryseolinea sp.]|nr:DUF998 domain-containing protein [Chryseolinea sp.]
MARGNDVTMTKWSFYAGITFIVLLAMLHVIKPEIEPSWNFISEYQVGRFGWLMSLAFVSLASSCLFLSIGLWKNVNIVGKIGIVMILLSSAGMFIAAIFKTDPLNTSPELVTQSGMLHQWGAMLDQIPFAALLITIALFRKKEWDVNRWLLIVSLIFVWFGMIYFIASIRIHFPADGKFGPNVLVGWQNRIMIVTQALWLILVAHEVNRQNKQSVIFA